ncbi:MAG: baseplate J/gp47 family protein [Methanobrevibacter sp.]|nr:baseplate J/gp47 family protein [Methanobrevibacter sp.]
MSSLNDESFYNILGEEISRNGLVQQMINFYGLLLEVGETRITDFNEGSEIRNFLETIAVDHYVILEDQNEHAKITFIDTAYGEWLDKHGLHPAIRLERNQGNEAVGEVTFTIPSVSTEQTIIPEGTLLASTETGLQFSTDYDAVIEIGDLNVDVQCTCMSVGEDGNVVSGSIDLIDDDFIDVHGITVTNTDAFTGGVDYEEDEAYRARLLEYVRREDFGSLPYYINLAETVPGVHDVKLVDEVGVSKKILVNGDVKETSDTLLVDVLTRFSDTRNLGINHTFNVAKPTFVKYSLEVTVDVDAELPSGTFEDLLVKYVDGGYSTFDGRIEFNGVRIGQSITKDEFVNALKIIGNVADATITIKNASSTSVDICSVEADEVVEITDVSVTQNVIGG